MSSHILKTDIRPIPLVEDQTQYVPVGPVTVGVEYRILADDISRANGLERPGVTMSGVLSPVRDRGVSLHVFGRVKGELSELLRFDCFDEGPHYHYVQANRAYQEILQLDPVADGDPLAWALEKIRYRLPQMLERVGAADLIATLSHRELEGALPLIGSTAYMARFGSDERAIHEAALNSPGLARSRKGR